MPCPQATFPPRQAAFHFLPGGAEVRSVRFQQVLAQPPADVLILLPVGFRLGKPGFQFPVLFRVLAFRYPPCDEAGNLVYLFDNFSMSLLLLLHYYNE